jgi:hypothetical protein
LICQIQSVRFQTLWPSLFREWCSFCRTKSYSNALWHKGRSRSWCSKKTVFFFPLSMTAWTLKQPKKLQFNIRII